MDQLLNPWLLAGYLEAAFFRLGSFGYRPRGEHMDFIYYRPITKSGPQVINSGEGYRHLLDYGDVLLSENNRDFFRRCGDIYNAESRYHPSRYLWINFYNMYHKRRGHLEFRVFNKTLNWLYLYASVELCKHFVTTCHKYKHMDLIKILKDTFGDISPLDDPPENHENYFNNILTVLGMENDIVNSILYDIWQKSCYPNYSDSKVFSHLFRRNHVHFREGYTRPKKLTKKEIAEVTKPYYVDIHYLKNRGLTVFPENQPCAS
jgi:hypothetical protein